MKKCSLASRSDLVMGDAICMYSRLKQSATLKRTHNYHIRELT